MKAGSYGDVPIGTVVWFVWSVWLVWHVSRLFWSIESVWFVWSVRLPAGEARGAGKARHARLALNRVVNYEC